MKISASKQADNIKGPKKPDNKPVSKKPTSSEIKEEFDIESLFDKNPIQDTTMRLSIAYFKEALMALIRLIRGGRLAEIPEKIGGILRDGLDFQSLSIKKINTALIFEVLPNSINTSIEKNIKNKSLSKKIDNVVAQLEIPEDKKAEAQELIDKMKLSVEDPAKAAEAQRENIDRLNDAMHRLQPGLIEKFFMGSKSTVTSKLKFYGSLVLGASAAVSGLIRTYKVGSKEGFSRGMLDFWSNVQTFGGAILLGVTIPFRKFLK